MIKYIYKYTLTFPLPNFNLFLMRPNTGLLGEDNTRGLAESHKLLVYNIKKIMNGGLIKMYFIYRIIKK